MFAKVVFLNEINNNNNYKSFKQDIGLYDI
jgi:hypothetical protein